ncbi:MAG: alpha/beta fold hydrolase [Kofleriaceae bacterium]|nr:alpha/beta fold hydrolase [Kofleriaceae bacterium]
MSLDTARFEFSGGDTGILLLHGYTSATPEVRPMGEYLAARGMHVVAPLLPGHGTTPADLNKRSWRELADAAADELYQLQGKCSRVYVGGLSMGGLLTLHLGQRCGGIAGLIPMAPALYVKDPMRFLIPFLKHFLPSIPKSKDLSTRVEDPDSEYLLWSYDQSPVPFAGEVMSLMHHVRDRLEMIEQPVLAFHGACDRTVPVKASEALIERASSSDKEMVLLLHSGHCLSVDGEREAVFAKTWRWIAEREGR